MDSPRRGASKRARSKDGRLSASTSPSASAKRSRTQKTELDTGARQASVSSSSSADLPSAASPAPSSTLSVDPSISAPSDSPVSSSSSSPSSPLVMPSSSSPSSAHPYSAFPASDQNQPMKIETVSSPASGEPDPSALNSAPDGGSEPPASAAASSAVYRLPVNKPWGDLEATNPTPRVSKLNMRAVQDVKQDSNGNTISFKLISNDKTQPPEALVDNLIGLVQLKNIFSKQLPKMPRPYIVRLIFDRQHCSICICKNNNIIGGICYRPFYTQRFAEIAFLAVTSDQQVRGYGREIMNHLKELVKTEDIDYFLTCADNHAVKYFKKQGFSANITMEKARYDGYIKDYTGSTLMECKINKKVDYLDVPGMIKEQRECLKGEIRKISNSHVTYPGFDQSVKTEYWQEGKAIPIEQIKGVVEAGWDPATQPLSQKSGRPTPLTDLQANCGFIWKKLKNLKDAWPFKEPVDAKLVPDYYHVIKQPMDLKTVRQRLDKYYYKDVKMFIHDILLIVNNCRQYNTPDTTYFRCANQLEEKFKEFLKGSSLWSDDSLYQQAVDELEIDKPSPVKAGTPAATNASEDTAVLSGGDSTAPPNYFQAFVSIFMAPYRTIQ
eukprot:g37835.t1